MLQTAVIYLSHPPYIIFQDLVEVAMSLKHAVERLYGAEAAALRPGGPLAAKLTEYAGLLAAQVRKSEPTKYMWSIF